MLIQKKIVKNEDRKVKYFMISTILVLSSIFISDSCAQVSANRLQIQASTFEDIT
jgi:hypothetical protein